MNADLDKWATWREIHAQPAIWRAWADAFDPTKISAWIDGLDIDQIWLSGAGTSAFIGDIIAAGLEALDGPIIRSVPSTDIVSRPKDYLTSDRVLVVNFGRSGDSTETIGVLDAMDALVPNAPRLNITCNTIGALATRASAGPQKVIRLPEATHDSGFAMTSSFSTMLLSALAILDRTTDFASRMQGLATECEALFQQMHTAPACPDRIVFLGTGPLAFAAREASLKVLELTAGQVPALWDSTLGFRHGPKSFVTGATGIFIFTQADPHARAYEEDLINELRAQYPNASITTVGPKADITIKHALSAVWAAPLAVAYAQILGVVWSAAKGLNVDNPFAGQGTLTRVVSGVKLYPVSA